MQYFEMNIMKNVIITGAHGDIGFAIAERLAEEKWNLYLTSKTQIELGKLESLRRKNKGRVEFYKFDITNIQDIKLFFQSIRKTTNQIDGLVNNAGIYPIIPFEQYTLNIWENVINVNITAPFYCIQSALPFMKNAGGKIVNISSIVAQFGSRDPGYATTKAGLIGLTKSCAKSLAKYKIFVNAVAPGIIDTQMSRRGKEEDRQKSIEATLLKRVGEVSDISGAVSFLLSKDSNYITGTTLDVNGGLYIR